MPSSFNPLPLPEPERIVAVYEDWQGRPGNVSAGNFVDAQAAIVELRGDDGDSVFELQPAVSGTAGARHWRSGDGRVLHRLRRSALDRPAFTDHDDQPGHEQVVVLSHRLWTRRFACGPDARRPGRAAQWPAVPCHRRHAGVVRSECRLGRAVGAGGVHVRAEGHARRALPDSLRPTEAGHHAAAGPR